METLACVVLRIECVLLVTIQLKCKLRKGGCFSVPEQLVLLVLR